ncbi:MAG TPA: GNAT family N-acetyltransferase [Oceanobacillus sp.]|nr:GNAT family N-acetyltransferase [Oceanobacillus sp.]
MVSLSLSNPPTSTSNGVRPVNLKTDLAALADLIEVAFADSMDSSGRAAVREMRALSRFGTGLGVIAGMNDLVQGIGLGYVWIEDGQLVGNVSIYPAHRHSGEGQVWIIANVAVQPEYRGRGIARKLMLASLDAIRNRRGGRASAILQVEENNVAARRLYDSLGFVNEGAWRQWRRSPSARIPPPFDNGQVYITKRRRGEWQAEYELATRIRPYGLGWQRPLHKGLFRRSIKNILNDLINMRSVERLVVHSQDEIRAVMWIERAFAASSTQLMLMVDPEYHGLYDEALINLATRRFSGHSPLTMEHPADDTVTSAILERYHFHVQRTLVHMRWEG